jgi:hypothetical protein
VQHTYCKRRIQDYETCEDYSGPVKKLNTYDIYVFAMKVHPLVDLKYSGGMTVNDVFWPLVEAQGALEYQIDGGTLFSASIKRSADALMRAINGVGVSAAKPDGLWDTESHSDALSAYQLKQVIQAAKDFETVLSNEMPGLAIYYISTKGIYSTDDLILHADLHIPESLRPALDAKAVHDIQQAGKCLAYEVSTASAFHMWRAVETVMNSYYKFLTDGHSFEDDKVQRNWAAYIHALDESGAERKITAFLDHIRSEYRNPQNHPSETVDLEQAFGLFGVATSVITQMAKAIRSGPEEGVDSAV